MTRAPAPKARMAYVSRVDIDSRSYPRVFISYAAEDQVAARYVAIELQKLGFDVGYDTWRDEVETSGLDTLSRKIRSRDACVVLVSPASMNSTLVMRELGLALDRRDVDVVPLLLEESEVPRELAGRNPVAFEFAPGDVSALVERIVEGSGAYQLDRLKPRALEELVGELLSRYGFELRQAERDGEADFRGTYREPFGIFRPIPVVVEVKSSRDGRIPLRQVLSFAERSTREDPASVAILVTNAQFTSAAHQALSDAHAITSSLRILDGPALRRLLLGNDDLFRKYSPGRAVR